ncbi:MAG TPA: hypothetical protein VMV69_04805 [Pirellulales bacterium]|nr:hypothetical protein [Pirellulales bacterium]
MHHQQRGRGAQLVDRLGIAIIGREGHDLTAACPACKSSDGFRVHQDTGVAYCYVCQARYSHLELAAHFLAGNQPAAWDLLAELGLESPRNGHQANGHADPIEAVARMKRVQAESLRVFGAKANGGAVEFPAYGPDGQQCSTFTIMPSGSAKQQKGMFARGKKAGLFLPHDETRAVRQPRAGETRHIVEGPKDAAAGHSLGLSFVGLNTCAMAAKFARLFIGVNVVLIPDRDRAGIDGAEKTARVLFGKAASIKIAALPAPVVESGGEDLRDVIRREGGREQVLQAIADAQEWAPPENPDDSRRTIEVTTEEAKVNDQAIEALADDDTLYQRGGMLVQVVREATLGKGILRPPGTPRIVPIEKPGLRERLTRLVRFEKLRVDPKGNESMVPCHVPDWCPSGIMARGQWQGIRPLEGVTDSPVLRADGTVLTTPGYDAATGLLYEPSGPVPMVPDRPTLAEVRAAVELLADVVVDFPFAHAMYKSAWVAGVLTPLARPAFRGPSPLILVDANVAGAGKLLLCNSASWICTGRDMAVMSCPAEDAEAKKMITSVAIGGDQILLIDNIVGDFGGPSFCAALTSTTWKDRLLGVNKVVELPLLTCWWATGNNVVLTGDGMARRVLHSRMDCRAENPEERTGFRHDDLRKYISANRTRLLGAALTILRGYCAAGRPDMKLKPWGSFEGWSNLVRQAVVWAGMPDPGQAREELAKRSDREAGALRGLIAGLTELDSDGIGVTAAEIIRALDPTPPATVPQWLEGLRDAILELCPAAAGKLPGSRSVGNKLRRLRGRVVGGRMIDSRDGAGGKVLWLVSSSESSCSSDSSCSAGNPTHGESRNPTGEEKKSYGAEGPVDQLDPLDQLATTEEIEQEAVWTH